LLNLSMEDLVSVRGIGQATAEKILKQLKGGVIQ
jgi:DNA uptake protein ComE-like DNA-binding protein